MKTQRIHLIAKIAAASFALVACTQKPGSSIDPSAQVQKHVPMFKYETIEFHLPPGSYLVSKKDLRTSIVSVATGRIGVFLQKFPSDKIVDMEIGSLSKFHKLKFKPMLNQNWAGAVESGKTTKILRRKIVFVRNIIFWRNDEILYMGISWAGDKATEKAIERTCMQIACTMSIEK